MHNTMVRGGGEWPAGEKNKNQDLGKNGIKRRKITLKRGKRP